MSTVDVFTASTDACASEVVSELATLLSPHEEARRLRLVRDVDRATFVIAHALLRSTLSAYGSTAPRDWRFDTNRHGCPRVVAAQAGVPALEFNLSHTCGLVAVAVTRGRRLGVDVECVSRKVFADLAERHFAPDEVRDLRSLPADLQPRAFFDYWTLKEAYIKARGMGLAIPLHEFSFAIKPPAPPVISFVDGFQDRSDRWQFWQAWPTTTHRLSLAIEREGADLEVFLTDRAPEALVASGTRAG